MNKCPVCGNEAATFVSHGGKASGVRRRSWFVHCPSCPTSFNISPELVNELDGRPAQASEMRARWLQRMTEAARRGEKITILY